MPNASLGEFLRSRRERLSPAAAGLPDRRRRRTPGLRREEVAELAGIGVDWYVRLEQGRTVNPSAATVDALARALRLDEAERNHLKALAGGNHRPAFVRETVPPVLRRLVTGLERPAYVTGRRWDLLAGNTAAAEVFDGLVDNVLTYLLLDPSARTLFGSGWPAEARRVTAQFRAAYDLWAGDPAFEELLGRLRDGCAEFAAWWERHDVRNSEAGVKTLHHPVRGVLRFEYATFQANDDPALKLTVYNPVAPRVYR
jgi:transcriptional regulator with XRE-family HTH domain